MKRKDSLARAIAMTVTAASALCAAAFAGPVAAAQPAAGNDFGVTLACTETGVNQQMSRGNALMRAQSWLDVHIPYSQTSCYTNAYGNYRQDCSGYVSMAWGLRHSYTTRDLELVTTGIAWDDLRPGDALNDWGSHVVLFVRWTDATKTKMIIVEQAGTVGTNQATWTRSTAASQGYTPIRYDNIVEDALPADRTEGDVTGDGFADLTTIEADGSLAVYGNGILTPENQGLPFKNRTWRTENTNWGTAAKSITTADVTGDRFADLIALTNAGKLEIYGNASKMGDGSPFTSAYRVYDNWASFTNVAAGDVNKDGWADLAATSTDGKLQIFLNTKETGANALPFRNVSYVYESGWGADVLDIALGDVTGDAYADLVATRTDGSLTVFGNGLLRPEFGGKPFQGQTWRVGTGWNLVYDITVSQVTNDGDADLTAITTGGELQVYKNSGNPSAPYSAAAWRYENWTGVKHIA
jgi:hypothetical protein